MSKYELIEIIDDEVRNDNSKPYIGNDCYVEIHQSVACQVNWQTLACQPIK